MKWRDNRVPLSACPYCGALNDRASSFEGHAPEPGNCAVCFYCSMVSVFADDMSLRVITAAEWAELPDWFKDQLHAMRRVVHGAKDES